jgi:SAM-dependent methyltransferase
MGSKEIPPEYYDYDYYETEKKCIAHVGYDPSGIFRELIRVIHPVFRAKSMLDIGCAYGWMQKLYPAEIAYGVDYSPYSMIKRVTNNYLRTSATHIPFKANTFDLIISTETFEHLTDNQLDDVFNEITRVGKKWLYLTTQEPIENEPNEDHINCKEREEWIDLAKEYGWKYNASIVRYIQRSRIAQIYQWSIFVFKVRP